MVVIDQGLVFDELVATVGVVLLLDGDKLLGVLLFFQFSVSVPFGGEGVIVVSVVLDHFLILAILFKCFSVELDLGLNIFLFMLSATLFALLVSDSITL